jgi:hypothetical protein
MFCGVSPIQWTSPWKTSQETAHTPFLKSTVGQAFFSVKESVRGGIQFGGGGN